jgi:nicotinate-nucleotide adenylyltransferase
MAAWIKPPGPVADGMRIGLLGGSFNPAHGGHLYVSEIARKALKLDYVWWLVSPGNPLKSEPAPLELRLVRARDAAQAPRIRVTDIERKLGTRYTVDTVTALQRRFPGVQFTWLMGSDNLDQFARWRRWRDIAARIPIAVVRRPGSLLASLHAPVMRLGSVRALAILDGPRSQESSTEYRAEALGAAAEAMLNLPPDRKGPSP